MPRLNLYEQQTTAQGPRASGADFGAAPAQALEGMGNVLQDIGERVQRREELGAAQDVMEGVDTWAVTALDDFQKRQDIMSAQALPEFQNALNQKRQEALSNFTGRPEARAALERQLDNQLAQYGKSAITAKIKAGQDQMGRALNQQFNKSMMQVDAAPDIWSFAKDENLAAVEMWKPAMSKDQYESAKRLAYAKPLQAAVRSHLAQGNIEGAEKLMTDESFSKYLTMDEARPLRIDAAVGRGKMEQEERRVQSNVIKFQSRLGRELTPDEVVRVRTLPAKKDMTPADEITELELIQQKPASQDQVDKIFKTYVDNGTGGNFGNSIRGRSVDYVTKNSVRYSNGLMTPEEARVFEASVVEAYAPVKVTDPLTGVITTREVTMPGFVKEAMNRGASFFAGAPATGAPRPGDTVQLDINGQVVGQGQVDSSGKWTIPAPTESAGAGAGRGGQGVPTAETPGVQPAPLPGLYDNVPFVAGPTAKLGQTISRTPLVGQDLGLDPRYVTAQKSMDIGQEQLAQALRPNSKIADTYRQELMKLVNITGKTWDNPQAMWLDIQTIDKELRSKLTQLDSVAAGKTAASMEDRKDALDISNAIRFSLQRLDVPQVKVNTKEEYDKLPPGTRYLFRDDPKPLTKK